MKIIFKTEGQTRHTTSTLLRGVESFETPLLSDLPSVIHWRPDLDYGHILREWDIPGFDEPAANQADLSEGAVRGNLWRLRKLVVRVTDEGDKYVLSAVYRPWDVEVAPDETLEEEIESIQGED